MSGIAMLWTLHVLLHVHVCVVRAVRKALLGDGGAFRRKEGFLVISFSKGM